MAMQVTLQQAEQGVTHALRNGLVPMLLGSPGIGKSEAVHQIAKKHNLFLLDFRLSQIDPTDLNGFPALNEEKTRSTYAPPLDIPLEGDEPPEGYDGWLLFFDEINAAPPAVQVAAYKIILDRKVGQHKIHENVAMVAAGNRVTDKAIVHRPSTAMQSRMVHFDVMVDHKGWIQWAMDNEIDYRIVSFIRFRPELLHKFDPNHNDHTFPCPRTWFFTSKTIKNWAQIEPSSLYMVAGCIGEGAALEFKGYADVFEQLPSGQEIESNPTGIPVPHEPSTLYALTALLGKIANASNIGKLLMFIERLPIEFQVITFQAISRGDDDLGEHADVQRWIKIHANELM